jgi:uncharacterized membrane protein YhaH (DUF805 family)
VSTPYGYQPEPDQGGQGAQYEATQFAPAPSFSPNGQQPGQPQAQQYGQDQYGQTPGQYGQPQGDQGQYGQGSSPAYGTPSYGQPSPQYGQSAPQYGQAYGSPQPGYGSQQPPYGQAAQPEYGQAAQPGYGTPQYGQQAPQYGTPQAYGQPAQAYGQPGYGAPGAMGAYGPYPGGLGGPVAAPGTYLAGAPASFSQAVSEGLKNTFVWRGRASRSAYWYFALATFGVDLLLWLLVVNMTTSPGVFFLGLLVMWAAALPLLGAEVRRLHDTGRSGWYHWISAIPIVGAILLLVALCDQSAPGPNQYG